MNRFPPPFTPFVGFLLLANGLLYYLSLRSPEFFTLTGALWPIGPVQGEGGEFGFFRPWQLLTYGFLHGSQTHLLLNLFGLWTFGRHLEAVWGSARFSFYFLFCVAGAGLVQLVLATVALRTQGALMITVGASGGLFGLLLAYAMLFPHATILLLIPPIPLKARWFVIIYAAVELYFGLTRTRSGVAHFAHLGGLAFGFLLLRWWQFRRDSRLYGRAESP